MRVIAFGDVHGCPHAAQSAVQLAEDISAVAIFLGDYVDRGSDSMGVLRVLMEAREANPDWVFLRGNHDQMLLDLIDGIHHPDGWDERTHREAYAEWLAASDQFRDLAVRFLRDLDLLHETEHFTFVHAPLIADGRALHEKGLDDLIWNYKLEPHWDGPRCVHGHYAKETMEMLPHRINVNTSCGYGGVLTGIVLDLDDGAVLGTCRIAEDGEILESIDR